MNEYKFPTICTLAKRYDGTYYTSWVQATYTGENTPKGNGYYESDDGEHLYILKDSILVEVY